MASTISPPDLTYCPDNFHVYIASCRSLREGALHQKITDYLTEEQFLVYKADSDLSLTQNADEGILRSKRVLFLLTKDGGWNEALFIQETTNAIEKVRLKSTRSVIVLVLVNMEVNQLPQHLRGYAHVVYNNDHGDNTDHVKLKQALCEDSFATPQTTPKINVGFTLASGHFYGYLRIVLPGLCKRIKEFIGKKAGKPQMSHKMFAIFPESCMCPADLCQMDTSSITKGGTLCLNVDKGGIAGRCFKAIVYKIKKDEKEYHAVIEYPGVVGSLFDMSKDKFMHMTDQERQREFQALFDHLQAFIRYHDYKLQDRIKLVYFNDKRAQFLDMIVKCIEEEIEQEKKHPVPEDSNIGLQSILSQLRISSHLTVPEYRPDARPEVRKAFIFNNRCYSQQTEHKDRFGSHQDVRDMTSLLRDDLKFDVEGPVLDESLFYVQDSFQDLNAKDLIDKMVEVAQADYKDVQVVLVCFMGHGNLGKLCGVDGKLVNITDITKEFARNPTLEGKPKIFIIEACQKTEGKDEDTVPIPSQQSEVDFCIRDHSANGANTFNDNQPKHVCPPLEHPSSPTRENDKHVRPFFDFPVEGEPSSMRASDENGLSHPLVQHPTSHGDHTTLVGNGSKHVLCIQSEPEHNTPVETESVQTSDMTTEVPESPIQIVEVISYDCLEHDDGPVGRVAQSDLVPGAPDFFMAYATLPGHVAIRHTDNGTDFIQTLCDVVKRNDTELSFECIMKNVTHIIKKKQHASRESSDLQYPFYIPTTEQSIFL